MSTTTSRHPRSNSKYRTAQPAASPEILSQLAHYTNTKLPARYHKVHVERDRTQQHFDGDDDATHECTSATLIVELRRRRAAAAAEREKKKIAGTARRERIRESIALEAAQRNDESYLGANLGEQSQQCTGVVEQKADQPTCGVRRRKTILQALSSAAAGA